MNKKEFESHTKGVVYLLVPPAIVWALVALFAIDDPLGKFVVDRVGTPILDISFIITGLVFPSAALVVGIRNIVRDIDRRANLIASILSVVFLGLMMWVVFWLRRV